MEIVVVDGHTLNPGDLSWQGVQRFGATTIHPRTAPSEIVDRCQNAEAVLTNKVPFSAETIGQLPGLKYIGVTATGYNIIDVEAAKRRGIVVSNVPEYGTASVAQHTFALLLELTQNVGAHAEGVRQGRWSRQPDFCYWDKPLVELQGLTLVILGFGRIGQAVGRIGLAFGMRVVAVGRKPLSKELDWAEQLPLEQALGQADVLSLHCPLTPETKGIINRERLQQMKKTAFLVNTSRGPLIVDQDLADALNEGNLAGAALDVLSVEPPPVSNPLLSAKNCLITPHQAWATFAARKRLLEMSVANLEAFARGTPTNRVA